MYFSEWGIVVNDVSSLNYAINLITLHNSSFSDTSKRLIAYSVFDFNDNLYMVVGNGGDPTLTSTFFSVNNDELTMYYPEPCQITHKKPEWWYKETGKEYLWNPETEQRSPDCPDYPPTSIFDL